MSCRVKPQQPYARTTDRAVFLSLLYLFYYKRDFGTRTHHLAGSAQLPYNVR